MLGLKISEELALKIDEAIEDYPDQTFSLSEIVLFSALDLSVSENWQTLKYLRKNYIKDDECGCVEEHFWKGKK